MKKQRGLTLIELTVALAIISIITAIAVLSVQSADRQTLYNASLKLQADLRYAQRMAMIEGRRWGVLFSYDSYHILRGDSSEFLQSNEIIKFTNGVEISAYNAPNVVYLPRGTVSSGFSVILSKGRYSQQLTGTVSSGRIEIKEMKPE